MPQVTQLDDQEETDWSYGDEQGFDNADGRIIPWYQAWAVAGYITWRHKEHTLLSVPFIYDPTPFLPGASTIYTPDLFHHSNSAEIDIAGTRTSTLPLLDPGDEWVMVDPYWRHQLLGWIEQRDYGSRESTIVGVSATTIEVGNLLLDPEDTDHMDLKQYVYHHFRPAGLIRDIWVPVKQKKPDRSNVVVVYAVDDAVGRALAMPPKEYFVDDLPHTISVRRRYTEHSWYPAPRSRVAALEAHVLSKRSTSINAIMWQDPDLAKIDTDYSLPSMSPPECRSFSEMPNKERFRTFFGFETLEIVRLTRPSPHERNVTLPSPPVPPTPPTGPPPDQSAPPPPTSQHGTMSSGSSTRRRVRTRNRMGRPVHALRAPNNNAVDQSIDPPTNVETNTADSIIGHDQPEAKKVRFNTGPSSPHSDGDSGVTIVDKSKYLADIVKTQIDLSRISAQLTRSEGSRAGKVYMKRKSGELDDDERSDSKESSDMDMDIDD